ncbi:MAG TPA: carboxymuconolactone decarboxylase family protein [Gemmatimonadaceae bacterium]|nr:carboxymuconolactone decarboxylase family protein [Gemmatimonadaceae bacterium]
MQPADAARDQAMMPDAVGERTFHALDATTGELVRLAAVIAVGTELRVRAAMARAVAAAIPVAWVEELILQSYLFAGFPRTLNAAREWRRASGVHAPPSDEGEELAQVPEWAARGERTCAVVYGEMYDRLRVNIRALHPALDAWMIVDGYGKVLSRPGLDLRRRELCIVAVCAAAGQDRQLHSHLHGALNAGASAAEVGEAIEAVADLMDEETVKRVRHLWARVRGK